MLNTRDQIESIQNKVKLYQSIQRYDAADKLLRNSIEKFGEFANIRYLLGLNFHMQSRFPEAVEEFKNAIEINPEYVEAILSLAVTLCDLSQYQEAANLLNELENQSKEQLPNYIKGKIANLHGECGHLYSESNMPKLALNEFEKALDLLSRMSDIRLAAAKLYLNNNEFEKAKFHLSELIINDPQNQESRVLLGLLYFREENHSKAQRYWKEAQDINPNSSSVKALLESISTN